MGRKSNIAPEDGGTEYKLTCYAKYYLRHGGELPKVTDSWFNKDEQRYFFKQLEEHKGDDYEISRIITETARFIKATNQPCWECEHAWNAKKMCSWAKELKPVSGWDAIMGYLSSGKADGAKSYVIRFCPLFEKHERKCRPNDSI